MFFIVVACFLRVSDPSFLFSLCGYVSYLVASCRGVLPLSCRFSPVVCTASRERYIKDVCVLVARSLSYSSPLCSLPQVVLSTHKIIPLSHSPHRLSRLEGDI